MKVRNPRTGLYDYEISQLSFETLKIKADTMRHAQKSWQAIGIEQRIKTIQRWKKVLERHLEELTEVLIVDTGRKIETVYEINLVLTAIDQFCDLAQDYFKVEVQTILHNNTYHIEEYSDPFELVGIISTWQFPFQSAMMQAIPALLAGNSVLVKPSEKTPRFVRVLEKTISQIPHFNNLLHFIEGEKEVGEMLCSITDLICFTGSEEKARKVFETSAKHFVPAQLAFGGKGAAIVTETADIESASSAILWGGTFNAGQSLESIERVYVHRNIHSQFLSRLVGKSNLLTLNYPNIEYGQIGPIITEKQATNINEQLADAVKKGAVIVAGAEKCIVQKGSIYCRPTILTNVSHHMRIMREMTFGPILPVKSFLNETQALDFANDSNSTFNCSVFAGKDSEAMKIARRIKSKSITINDVYMGNRFYRNEKSSTNAAETKAENIGTFSFKKFLNHKNLMFKK
ncbi:aldehyde dehydrogenase family protein [Arcicella aquatica]|uniref:Aldehyde dehydrogenase family protein n=1 Tax=Arcicella aquatica TaxID=217141 RepID=A0ABU5QIN9_9BACT|nr:aldehyde dehydrogenase family protein [Arcicella aquatica]MEA5256921.1 aldehyde dehydrogenase family protein [Arcicella aquatica]